MNCDIYDMVNVFAEEPAQVRFSVQGLLPNTSDLLISPGDDHGPPLWQNRRLMNMCARPVFSPHSSRGQHHGFKLSDGRRGE